MLPSSELAAGLAPTVHAYAESNYVSGELLVYLEIESDFTRPHFKDLNSWRINA